MIRIENMSFIYPKGRRNIHTNLSLNLEENKPSMPTAENTAISRWRAFGLQKGVLRV